jgi:tetratricopeptide (TPR) repeat protein
MGKRNLFLLGAAAFLLPACSQVSEQDEAIASAHINGEHAVLVDGAGDYSRQIATSSPVAQALFDQGLNLTWGYYFPEAYASFQEALRHDPDNPMILWGMALSASPNPNSRHNGFADDPEEAGLAAIRRANELVEGLSDKDRKLVEALYTRYDKESVPDPAQRDAAYLELVRKLVAEFPEDPDVVSAFADASMIISPWNYWDDNGNPTQAVAEAIGYLEGSLEQKPNHPGTNHLYMHIMESSPHPERALPNADRLEGIMPRIGHMVHMPSHIYVRTGDYERSIASNRRSLSADEYFTEKWDGRAFPTVTSHKLSSQVHPWHALDFIRYSAAVQGNYATALEAGQAAALEAEAEQGETAGRTQLAKAHVWMLHRIFGKWDVILSQSSAEFDLPYLDGMVAYARGSAFVARGDLAQANAELRHVRSKAASLTGEIIPGIANSPERLLMIAVNILQGEIEEAQGNLEPAIASYSRAVEIEDALRYGEPPNWPIASRLFLGRALLDADRAAEAEQVFKQDLEWHQNNGWALFGLNQALGEQGKTEAAENARKRFSEAWKNADVQLQAARL